MDIVFLSASPMNYCLNFPCGKHGECHSSSNGYMCITSVNSSCVILNITGVNKDICEFA